MNGRVTLNGPPAGTSALYGAKKTLANPTRCLMRRGEIAAVKVVRRASGIGRVHKSSGKPRAAYKPPLDDPLDTKKGVIGRPTNWGLRRDGSQWSHATRRKVGRWFYQSGTDSSRAGIPHKGIKRVPRKSGGDKKFHRNFFLHAICVSHIGASVRQRSSTFAKKQLR